VYQLVFTETYLKREKDFIKRHPDLIERYKKTMRLLEINPFHPSLRLHKLKGKQKDYYSASITISYRVIITFRVEGNEIILIDVGHHDEVY
jgi:addiction module RelE/StbE family toxin